MAHFGFLSGAFQAEQFFRVQSQTNAVTQTISRRLSICLHVFKVSDCAGQDVTAQQIKAG